MFRSKLHPTRVLLRNAIAAFSLATTLWIFSPRAHGQTVSSSQTFMGGGSAQLFLFDPEASAAAQSAIKPKPVLGAVTIGWTTLYADEGASEREDINGPFYRLSFDTPRGFSVFFDSTNYYGRNRKGSLNGHGFTFGVGHGVFPTRHVKPNFFAESGIVRTSNAGSIVDQFAFASGLSFSFPINRHVQLALTPAEWVFLYPDGDPRNDYNAKVGLSFPFGHR